MIWKKIIVAFAKTIEFLNALCFIILPLWLLYGSLLLQKYVWSAVIVLVINLVAAAMRYHESKYRKIFLFGITSGLVLAIPIFIALRFSFSKLPNVFSQRPGKLVDNILV